MKIKAKATAAGGAPPTPPTPAPSTPPTPPPAAPVAPPPAAPPPTAPVAPAESPKESTELVPAGERPADLPAYIQPAATGGLAEGLENSAGSGLQLPMLFLAQPLTPTVVASKLKPGDIFINTSNEEALFGAGQEANIIPFFHFREWICWADRTSNMGIIARSKDPRGDLARRWQQQWNGLGKRDGEVIETPNGAVKAKIQEYHVFFVLFEGSNEPIALPLSRTKHKKGRLLLSLALRRGPTVPLFAGKYALSPVLEQNKQAQPYWNFDFKPAGWASKEEYEAAKKLYATVKEQYNAMSLDFDDQPETEEEPSPTAAPAAPGSY